jgi:ABC-type transporter Mla MlaB component
MTASPRQSVAFAIRGPIERDDLPGLCERVCTVLGANEGCVVHCDVAGVGVDAVVVDALARLQLVAARRGCQVRIRHASLELRRLILFMGLADVLVE